MLLFARNFIKHPKMLGSFIPSSRYLIDKTLAAVDWNRTRVFVEYGPGVGTFTTEVLRRMRPDATLLAIETNRDFVRFLGHKVRDPRLMVVNGSAAKVADELDRAGQGRADYVLSGIPFSTMPRELRESIVQATRDVLHPDGAFLVYQFSRGVLPDLQRTFGSVSQDFEPLNIPPAQVFVARP